MLALPAPLSQQPNGIQPHKPDEGPRKDLEKEPNNGIKIRIKIRALGNASMMKALRMTSGLNHLKWNENTRVKIRTLSYV